jgi:hypothetical protein
MLAAGRISAPGPDDHIAAFASRVVLVFADVGIEKRLYCKAAVDARDPAATTHALDRVFHELAKHETPKHTPGVLEVTGRRYPFRAICSCGWEHPVGYVAAHAAYAIAEDHASKETA